MVGMFSFMDAMLDTEMKEVMESLPVTDAVKDALVDHKGMFAPFLDAVIAYERRHFDRFMKIVGEYDIDGTKVAEYYLEAVRYANGMVWSRWAGTMDLISSVWLLLW